MRDLLKNPLLYYVAAPILVGLWPLLVWGVYLPAVQRQLAADKGQYEKAEGLMLDILNLDPGRVEESRTSQNSGKFIPYEAVSRAADRCGIPSRQYDATAGGVIKTSGKETQGVKTTLSDVDIAQACRFLSTIQSTWVNLDCESLKLTKKEGAPDKWDADLSFKYTF